MDLSGLAVTGPWATKVTPARVLWLIKGLGLGGAERLLATMAAKMDRQRFDIEVAYLLPGNANFAAEFEAIGVRTVCLDARWTAEFGWPNRLRRLLRDRDYALIHTHSPVPAISARVWLGREVPLIHTEHNLWGSYRLPTYLANAATFGRNCAAIAVSDAVRDSMVRPTWLGGDLLPPIEALHHGVDLDRLHRGTAARAAARRLLGVDDRVPLIGSVASFTPQKDHAGLLEALDRVRDRVPGIQLVLVGSGPLESQVRGLVAKHRLQDHVRFLGARDDVATLLPGLDLFVLGSRFEGLPVSLLEAMASQVACVAARVGGIPEALLDGRDGQLVPPGDPAALAQAIVGLLHDAVARSAFAAAGYERVRTEFSIDRAVRRTEELYDEVLP